MVANFFKKKVLFIRSYGIAISREQKSYFAQSTTFMNSFYQWRTRSCNSQALYRQYGRATFSIEKNKNEVAPHCSSQIQQNNSAYQGEISINIKKSRTSGSSTNTFQTTTKLLQWNNQWVAYNYNYMKRLKNSSFLPHIFFLLYVFPVRFFSVICVFLFFGFHKNISFFIKVDLIFDKPMFILKTGHLFTGKFSWASCRTKNDYLGIYISGVIPFKDKKIIVIIFSEI